MSDRLLEEEAVMKALNEPIDREDMLERLIAGEQRGNKALRDKIRIHEKMMERQWKTTVRVLAQELADHARVMANNDADYQVEVRKLQEENETLRIKIRNMRKSAKAKRKKK